MSTPGSTPIPYPADTEAKGWRFELDLDRIKKSDTWALCKPELRPWLLMLWATAWGQKPCGTLPSSDELICAHSGMPEELFAEHRERLMRGWWMAEDGRYYHDTLAERVVEMLANKEKDRARKAGWRQRTADGNAPPSDGGDDVSRGTNVGQAGDSDRKDVTGTSTGTSTKSPSLRSGEARKRAPALPLPDGVQQETWDGWLALRKGKKAAVTETVVTLARREADKAGITLQGFLEIWCLRGSQGLMASWLEESEVRGRRGPGYAKPNPHDLSGMDYTDKGDFREFDLGDDEGGDHAPVH